MPDTPDRRGSAPTPVPHHARREGEGAEMSLPPSPFPGRGRFAPDDPSFLILERLRFMYEANQDLQEWEQDILRDAAAALAAAVDPDNHAALAAALVFHPDVKSVDVKYGRADDQ